MYIEDDATLYLTTYINAHNNDQRCLIENDNHIILTGDQYHDKIIEKIEGFMIGVQFTDVHSIEHKEIVIRAEDKMFDICGFTHELIDIESLCPDCGEELTPNHYVDESKGRVYGVICLKCMYEKYDE